jgi:hypothetical protein
MSRGSNARTPRRRGRDDRFSGRRMTVLPAIDAEPQAARQRESKAGQRDRHRHPRMSSEKVAVAVTSIPIRPTMLLTATVTATAPHNDAHRCTPGLLSHASESLFAAPCAAESPSVSSSHFAIKSALTTVMEPPVITISWLHPLS